MRWGSISWFVPGTVTAVNGNINLIKYQDILEDHLWRVIAQHFPQGGRGYIFQDDNAQVDRAYKSPNNIPSLTWPAQSPDLNIIVNLFINYYLIKRKLQARNTT